MSVNEKMTSIADKIRALLGLTGTMGLDAMAENLGTEQSNITAALASIAEKGVEVPDGSNSNNLAALIEAITGGESPKGLLEVKLGSFAVTDSSVIADTISISPGFATSNRNYQNFASFVLLWHEAPLSSEVEAKQIYNAAAIAAFHEDLGGKASSITLAAANKAMSASTNGTVEHENGIITSFTLPADLYIGIGTFHWIAGVM